VLLDATNNVVELIGQLDRKCREVVDEIQGVLDLMRDAGGELAEGGELLGLDQSVVGLPEFLKRQSDRLR
jgi:hypothetical protein